MTLFTVQLSLPPSPSLVLSTTVPIKTASARHTAAQAGIAGQTHACAVRNITGPSSNITIENSEGRRVGPCLSLEKRQATHRVILDYWAALKPLPKSAEGALAPRSSSSLSPQQIYRDLANDTQVDSAFRFCCRTPLDRSRSASYKNVSEGAVSVREQATTSGKHVRYDLRNPFVLRGGSRCWRHLASSVDKTDRGRFGAGLIVCESDQEPRFSIQRPHLFMLR